MPLPPTTLARLAKLVDSAITPQHAERVRRIEQATNADGTVRGEQITGLVPARARWPIEPEQVAVPGFDYDTLQDLLDALNTAVGALGGTYLPIASPTFTGTLTGPDISATDDVTVADLLTVHHRILSTGTAPTVVVGAAAGTGATASIAGTDLWGALTVTTGTGTGTGTLATITFNQTRTATFPIVLFPSGNNARLAMPSLRADTADRTTAHWILTTAAALTVSVAHVWYYITGGEY